MAFALTYTAIERHKKKIGRNTRRLFSVGGKRPVCQLVVVETCGGYKTSPFHTLARITWPFNGLKQKIRRMRHTRKRKHTSNLLYQRTISKHKTHLITFTNYDRCVWIDGKQKRKIHLLHYNWQPELSLTRNQSTSRTLFFFSTNNGFVERHWINLKYESHRWLQCQMLDFYS